LSLATKILKKATKKLPQRLSSIVAGSILKRNTIVPFYHVIEDCAENALPDEEHQLHTITLANFNIHLDLLKKYTNIVSLETLQNRILNRKSVKGYSAITFDDGCSSFFTHALPVLKEKRIPVTLFVTTSLLAGDLFWRDKVREIIKRDLTQQFVAFAHSYPALSGLTEKHFYQKTKHPSIDQKMLDTVLDVFLAKHDLKISQSPYMTIQDLNSCDYDLLTIGNHTHAHYMLSSLSIEDQSDEISTAQKKLQEWGLDTKGLFSIPFGGKTTYSDETLSLLNQLGYTNISATGDKLSSFQRVNDEQTIIYRTMASNSPNII